MIFCFEHFTGNASSEQEGVQVPGGLEPIIPGWSFNVFLKDNKNILLVGKKRFHLTMFCGR